MVYSVNGVALDNDALGWIFLGASEPIANIIRRVSTQAHPNRHGNIALPSTMDAPVLMLKVETPRTNLESLMALFNMDETKVALTASPTREVVFQFLSSRSEGFGVADEAVQVEFLIRLNGVFWRDVAETTTAAVNLDVTPKAIAAFVGISAPIEDPQIRVKGAVTGLRIEDSGGSWFTYSGTLTATEYLLFIPAEGIARVGTNAASWDDWTRDVTSQIDYGGPDGTFRLAPKMIIAPTSRQAELTIITVTRSAATVQVRGKGAYIV